MYQKKQVALFTLCLFLLTFVFGSYDNLYSQKKKKDDEILKQLDQAESQYQEGNFKKAIEIYENVIVVLQERKELAVTKQKLFQTMLSLAYTYFTIQENQKASDQLEKLLQLNPKQELDPEFYPPAFIQLFNSVQSKWIGGVSVTSDPAGTEVFFNGKSMGKAPFKLDSVGKGQYNIMAKKKGYRVYIGKLTVDAARESTLHIVLEKETVSRVIEKKSEKPKKKKKISPLLIVGGLALAAVVVVLALPKKEDDKKQEPAEERFERIFGIEPFDIEPRNITVVVIPVDGIQGRLELTRIGLLVNHPAMNDLVITLRGTDNLTNYVVWQREESPNNPTEINEETRVFNSLPVNGGWHLSIRNAGDEPGRVEGGDLFLNLVRTN